MAALLCGDRAMVRSAVWEDVRFTSPRLIGRWPGLNPGGFCGPRRWIAGELESSERGFWPEGADAMAGPQLGYQGPEYGRARLMIPPAAMTSTGVTRGPSLRGGRRWRMCGRSPREVADSTTSFVGRATAHSAVTGRPADDRCEGRDLRHRGRWRMESLRNSSIVFGPECGQRTPGERGRLLAAVGGLADRSKPEPSQLVIRSPRRR